MTGVDGLIKLEYSIDFSFLILSSLNSKSS